MSDIRLPQRPMVELAPPVDGLDQVRGEAGRRRRRRAGVAAAGLTTAAGLAVMLALSGGAAGVDVLKPAPPAGQGIDAPSPSANRPTVMTLRPATTRHRHQGGQTSVRAQGRAGAAADGGPVHVAGAQPNANGAAAAPIGQPARTQQPTLRRWQSTYTGSARECAGSTYGDTSGTLKSAVDWCLDVVATPLSNGVQLHVELCRDSTGGGTLSFSGSREVDLAVKQGKRTVWDWAALHPGGSDAHQLSEPANGCMNWSVVWPDITTAGSTAGHGDFTFVGTSTADEMQGTPRESVDFAY
jgi:hypothetical protein